MSAAGLPSDAMTLWLGVSPLREGLSRIVAELNSGTNRALGSPKAREQTAQQGAEMAYGTPESNSAALKADLTPMCEIIRVGKIEAQ